MKGEYEPSDEECGPNDTDEKIPVITNNTCNNEEKVKVRSKKNYENLKLRVKGIPNFWKEILNSTDPIKKIICDEDQV